MRQLALYCSMPSKLPASNSSLRTVVVPGFDCGKEVTMPPDASGNDPTVTKAKDGRGGFFAVDRRTWHFVTSLGLDPAMPYLVMARATGGDDRSMMRSVGGLM